MWRSEFNINYTINKRKLRRNLWRSPARNLWVCVAVCMAAVLLPTGASAQFTDGPEAEESGRTSLKSRAYPWYDAGKDSGAAPDVEVHKEPYDDPQEAGNRNSTWLYEEPAPTTTAARPTMPLWLMSVLEILTWLLLFIVVAAAIGLLIWAFARFRAKPIELAGDTQPRTQDRTTDVDRVEELPVNINVDPHSDPLSEARRLFAAGDYAQAAVYLYSYKLLILDRVQHIRLMRGKTNRQYLMEVRVPALRGILKPTMVMFEDAFFGKHEITRQRCETCFNSIEPFESLIATHPAT